MKRDPSKRMGEMVVGAAAAPEQSRWWGQHEQLLGEFSTSTPSHPVPSMPSPHLTPTP